MTMFNQLSRHINPTTITAAGGLALMSIQSDNKSFALGQSKQTTSSKAVQLSSPKETHIFSVDAQSNIKAGRLKPAAKSPQNNPEIVKRPNGYYTQLPTLKQRVCINREKLSARNVIVKIGTNTVMNADKTDINTVFVKRLAKDLQYLKSERGINFTLIISGAVAMGRMRQPKHNEVLQKRLETLKDQNISAQMTDTLKAEYTIQYKQGLAGIGQPVLYAKISDVFLENGLQLSQTLVTKADMKDIQENPKTHNNLYSNQFSKDTVSVINANDTLCSYQIKTGDNDNLAIRIGEVIEADTVVILSDVDGIYTGRPEAGNPKVYHLPYIDKSTMDLAHKIAKGASTAEGTGGMEAKVNAIDEIAFPNGMSVVISKGDQKYPLRGLLNVDTNTFETSTWFIPKFGSPNKAP